MCPTDQPLCVVLYGLLYVELTIGLVGNAISFAVFARRNFARIPVTVYFRLSLFVDSASLLFVARFLSKSQYRFDIDDHAGPFGCKLLGYLDFVVPALSGHLLVLASAYQLLTILAPHRHRQKQHKSTRCAHLVEMASALGMLALNLAVYAPILLSRIIIPITHDSSAKNSSTSGSSISNTTGYATSSVVAHKTCSYQDDSKRLLVFWVDFFNSTWMPFAIMLVCTGVTLRVLWRSRMRARRSSSVRLPAPPPPPPPPATYAASAITAAQIANGEQQQQRQQCQVTPPLATAAAVGAVTATMRRRLLSVRDTRFAFNSLALNVKFLVLNLPLAMFNLINGYNYSFMSNEPAVLLLYVAYFAQFAISFAVNLLINELFKRELSSMVAEWWCRVKALLFDSTAVAARRQPSACRPRLTTT